MRPQHRHMISDVSGIGRPGSDVDEGGAPVVGLHDMPSRHLWHALRGCTSRPGITEPRIAPDDVAWLDENVTVRITRSHALATHERKRIGIELVIGQSHKILEVLRIGARVVVQSMQRIIDAAARNRESGAGTPGGDRRVPLTMASSMPARSGVSKKSRSGRSPTGKVAEILMSRG